MERHTRRLPNTRKANSVSYILIVDDDTNSRKLLSTNLEKRGQRTLAVPRIADGLLEGPKAITQGWRASGSQSYPATPGRRIS